MSKQNTDGLGPPPKTKTVHVGMDRYSALADAAIELSYQCKRQFTAGQIMKYLIDHYTEDALQKLKQETLPDRSS